MNTLLPKPSELIRLITFVLIIFGALFFSQKYMAMTSNTCCSIGYLQKQYFYTRSFMVGNDGNIIANGMYWQPSTGWNYYFLGKFLANSTLDTQSLLSVPWNQYSSQSYTDNSYKDIWENANGDVFVVKDNVLTKFDSNLSVLNTLNLSLELNYTSSGWKSPTDSVAFDGNGFMYIIGTKLISGVSDGYLYLAKYDLNTMSQVGTSVQVMPYSAMFAQGSGIGLEYSSVDNSLGFVYATTPSSYSIQKFVTNFNSGTYSTVFSTPKLVSAYGLGSFEIDKDGDILVSTYDNGYVVKVFDPNMNLDSTKTSNFTGVWATKIEPGPNDTMFFQNQFGIQEFIPELKMNISGITAGQVLTQNAVTTLTLTLNNKPISPVYLDVVPDGGSNILVNSGSGFVNSTQVMFDSSNWSSGIQIQVKYIGGVNDKTLENINFSVDTTKTTIASKCVALNTSLKVDKVNILTDPAVNQKVVSSDGTYIIWSMYVVNPADITTSPLPLKYEFTDIVPSNTSYVQGSLMCTAHGSSVSISCYYDIVQNKVVWIGNLAANGATTTASGAGNEVTVAYKTTLPGSSMTISNQASACKDTNLDGYIDSEDFCLLSDDPSTNAASDPTLYNYTFVSSSSSTTTSASSSAPNCTTQNYNISGNVYLDSNKSATKDTSESGLNNVQVKLYDSNNNLISTTTSDANGNYDFAGIQAGNYKITVISLNNYSVTTSATISVVLNSNVTNQNFGQVMGLAATGGEVWYLKLADYLFEK